MTTAPVPSFTPPQAAGLLQWLVALSVPPFDLDVWYPPGWLAEEDYNRYSCTVALIGAGHLLGVLTRHKLEHDQLAVMLKLIQQALTCADTLPLFNPSWDAPSDRLPPPWQGESYPSYLATARAAAHMVLDCVAFTIPGQGRGCEVDFRAALHNQQFRGESWDVAKRDVVGYLQGQISVKRLTGFLSRLRNAIELAPHCSVSTTPTPVVSKSVVSPSLINNKNGDDSSSSGDVLTAEAPCPPQTHAAAGGLLVGGSTLVLYPSVEMCSRSYNRKLYWKGEVTVSDECWHLFRYMMEDPTRSIHLDEVCKEAIGTKVEERTIRRYMQKLNEALTKIRFIWELRTKRDHMRWFPVE